MTTISQALNGTISLIKVGCAIYEEVTKFMDVVQAEGGNGANKKAWVLAAAKHLILESGKNWNKWEKSKEINNTNQITQELEKYENKQIQKRKGKLD